jgi:hypothetical protein
LACAIPARGTRLYELACERDLEGIVAKWARGSYQCDGRATSWLKVKNPDYSRWKGGTSCSQQSALSGADADERPRHRPFARLKRYYAVAVALHFVW